MSAVIVRPARMTKPSAAMIDGDPLVYVIVCAECGATGPKSVGELADAVHAWNQRFGIN